MTMLATPTVSSLGIEAHAIEFRLTHGREGFAAIKEEWDLIAAQLAHVYVYQRYEWYQSYLEALETDPERMNFIVAYCDGEPRAIYPLRLQSTTIFGLRVRLLTLPQHPHLSLGDFIHGRADEDRGLFACLIGFLRSQPDLRWDLLCVPNALDGSAAEFAVQELPVARRYSREQKGCHYVRCEGAYDELRKKFSRKTRANLNTHRNRLAREGTSEFVFARDGMELDAALEEFISLEG